MIYTIEEIRRRIAPVAVRYHLVHMLAEKQLMRVILIF